MTNPSNIPTAQVRIKMLESVISTEIYPRDWFLLNEMEQDFMSDKITYKEYDKFVGELLEYWK